MKKIIAAMMIIALVVVMAVSVSAADLTEGIYTYKVNDDGQTVTITKIKVEAAIDLEIPSTLGGKKVTAIGDKALNWGSANTNVKKLTLPETLETIGKFAFGNNRAVKELVIPNSVTMIDEDAFAKFEGLESLTIGTGVKTVGERAFSRTKSLKTITVAAGNTALKVENNCLIDIANAKVLTAKAEATIAIPEGVKVIGDHAFYNSVVTNVTFPASLEKIGVQAFYGAKPVSVVLTSVKEIGAQAFYANKSLTTLELGNALETIDYEAFRGCTGIAKIVLPQGFKTMGYNAFYGTTGLRTLVIPKSVEEIGYGAFVNGGLKSANDSHVYYEGTRAEYEAINWTLNPSAGTTQNNDAISEDASRATKHYESCMNNPNGWTHSEGATCTYCNPPAGGQTPPAGGTTPNAPQTGSSVTVLAVVAVVALAATAVVISKRRIED